MSAESRQSPSPQQLGGGDYGVRFELQPVHWRQRMRECPSQGHGVLGLQEYERSPIQSDKTMLRLGELVPAAKDLEYLDAADIYVVAAEEDSESWWWKRSNRDVH
jgi:hypothetical protein